MSVQDTMELLPCPFCGGEANGRTDSTSAWVECSRCEIGTKYSRNAAEQWNTRTLTTEIESKDEALAEVIKLIQNASIHSTHYQQWKCIDKAHVIALAALKERRRGSDAELTGVRL